MDEKGEEESSRAVEILVMGERGGKMKRERAKKESRTESMERERASEKTRASAQ